MNLGKTIKDLRSRKNIKQNELADKVSLTQAYLSKIENNQQEPTITVLRNIARELDVPLPILFFHALDQEDIQAEKREAFEIIQPSLQRMVESFF